MLKVVYYFRLVLYTVILLSVSFLAVFIGLVSTILGKRLNTNYYVARTFYFLAGSLLGWKLEVEGEEHLWTMKNVGGEGIDGEASTSGRSAVMLANHQR
jgi:phosphatidylinositol glycan class A protein